MTAINPELWVPPGLLRSRRAPWWRLPRLDRMASLMRGCCCGGVCDINICDDGEGGTFPPQYATIGFTGFNLCNDAGPPGYFDGVSFWDISAATIVAATASDTGNASSATMNIEVTRDPFSTFCPSPGCSFCVLPNGRAQYSGSETLDCGTDYQFTLSDACGNDNQVQLLIRVVISSGTDQDSRCRIEVGGSVVDNGYCSSEFLSIPFPEGQYPSPRNIPYFTASLAETTYSIDVSGGGRCADLLYLNHEADTTEVTLSCTAPAP